MGNAASALPYSIGNKIEENQGWSFHEGSRKSDGYPVSVFQAHKPTLAKTAYDINHSQMFQIFPAYHHYQNCKKLRHPHILQVQATLDTDYPNNEEITPGGAANPAHLKGLAAMATTGDLIVVTEPCVPLKTWLVSQPTREQLSWGLQCIVEALSFLHNSAKLAHGNVSTDAFYVTPAGDVKLWNFSLVTPIGVADGGGGPTHHFRDWEGIISPNSCRSPERRESRWEAIATSAVHCMDSYSLGVFITHWYEEGVPPQLEKALQRLQTTSLRARPRLQPLLRCPIFDTPYRAVQMQLEEFSVQPVEQKVAFWQGLPGMLESNTLNEAVALHKVFPLMKSSILTITQNDAMLAQDMYRREVLAIMAPMFYVAETYLSKEPERFANELSPLIALLFRVNDRGVRGALLGRTQLFTLQLNKSQLNSAVFEPMCSGFSDSSSVLRELTLKATMFLVPHLTSPNAEKLSRYLVRLQSDPESAIRVNTVIFIGKLAPHLSQTSRSKMLLPAFTRAMRDPFDPCRLSALQAIQKSMSLFDSQGVATQVMPVVAGNLLDQSQDVRREAFAVVDACLVVLKNEDSRMTQVQSSAPLPPPVPSSSVSQQAIAGGLSATKHVKSGPPASSNSGGYLSGISSWMGTPAKPDRVNSAPTPSSADAPSLSVPAPAASQPQFCSVGLSDANIGGGGGGGGDGDGWDDEEDDMMGFGDDQPTTKPSTSMGMGISGVKKPVVSSAVNAWNEEEAFFSTFESKSKPQGSFLVGSSRSASTGGKLITPKTTSLAQRKAEMAQKKALKAKPDITKLALADTETDWDDF